MTTESPESGLGSGGKLAVELKTKADLGEVHMERNLSKRDDLRIAALEKYASQKAVGPDAFPLIRAGNIQHSPNKTTSTTASAHTAIGNDESILKRQGSASFSTGNIPRSSRSNSPTKRPVAAVIENYHDIVGYESQAVSQEQPAEAVAVAPAALEIAPIATIDEEATPADSEPTSGLDFLLQACDILEPGATELNSGYRKAPRNSSRRPSFEQQQVVTTSRGRASRRPSDEGEFDYTPGHSSEDEDDYRPSRPRANGRPARRAASRAVAATTAAAMSGGGASSGGRGWERGLVNGPCTNPDCEHPHDSPQWRKGPPTNPILCNACGTRWLRNGTLKPLVPRRGIRYGKARPKGSVKAAAEARADAAAARSARREAAELAALQHEQQYSMMNQDEYDEEEGYYEDEMVAAPAPAPRRRHAMAPAVGGAPLPAHQPLPIAEIDPTHAMMSHAMAAAFPGFGGAPGFFGMPQQSMHAAAAADPVLFQQQLMAMTAAAQAAQQAFYAAQMEMQQQQQNQHQNQMAMAAAAAVAEQQEQPQCNNPMKPASDGLQAPSRPVFNIQAVAGPQIAAPLYQPQA